MTSGTMDATGGHNSVATGAHPGWLMGMSLPAAAAAAGAGTPLWFCAQGLRRRGDPGSPLGIPAGWAAAAGYGQHHQPVHHQRRLQFSAPHQQQLVAPAADAAHHHQQNNPALSAACFARLRPLPCRSATSSEPSYEALGGALSGTCEMGSPHQVAHQQYLADQRQSTPDLPLK